MSESQIQSKLIKQYERDGFYVVKLVVTNKAGIPDLMLIKDGRVSFVEVKRAGGKPTALQLHRANELRDCRCNVRFVTEGDRDVEIGLMEG